MIDIAISVFIYFGSFMLGIFTLFGYMIYRCMKNMTDKSNMTNAMRLLNHVVLHPQDFGKMYYLTSEQYGKLVILGIDPAEDFQRPSWYEDQDEFEGVVKTRP